MKLNVNAICNRGTGRENNGDMISSGGTMLRDAKLSMPVSFPDEGSFHLLVSDGRDGRASSMLLEHLRDCFAKGEISEEDFDGDITRAVRYVGRKLNALSESEAPGRTMACTLSGIVWSGGKIRMVNAGNSRSYLFHEGMIELLSPVDEDMSSCVGGCGDTSLTVLDISDRVEDGDILLVCSDGLGDVATEDYLEYHLMTSPTPAEDLLDWAEREGSPDNISVIAARVGGGDFGPDGEAPDDDGRFDAWA